MNYIVEKQNGNPRIMKINDDGTYSAIAFGAGENSLPAIKEMYRLANRTVDTDE